MSKHTPGPWKVGPRQLADNTVEITEYPGYPSVIARVCPRPHYNDDQKANARLIAAAPDLLSVLNTILDEVDADYTEGVPLPSWDTAAREAIAKAVGEGE